jgi:hypothetical protein
MDDTYTPAPSPSEGEPSFPTRAPAEMHPMLKLVERPLIRTMPMQRLAAALLLALESGNRGMNVDGDGRIGKDTAFDMLSQDSSWRPFPMAFFNVSWPLGGKSGETYFFNQILLTGNCKTSRPVSGNSGLFRARNFLLSHAAQVGAEVIVLGIYEAQSLQYDDFKHLMSLDNEFRGTGKRLFVVLIHQRDADPAGVQALDRRPPPQLVGRFMGIRHHYTGLLWDPLAGENAEAGDVALALGEYDHTMRWPEWDGPSYTQFFAPRAYAAGWRLATQVDLIRKMIELVRAENGLTAVAPWPMKSFEAFVYFALVRTAGEDPHFMQFTEARVRDCVRRSGYIDLELSRVPEGHR